MSVHLTSLSPKFCLVITGLHIDVFLLQIVHYLRIVSGFYQFQYSSDSCSLPSLTESTFIAYYVLELCCSTQAELPTVQRSFSTRVAVGV